MKFKKIVKIFGEPLYPRLVPADEFRKSLVISPHPDDDVIGLGGTIHSIRERVWIVHVTGGGRGIPGIRQEQATKIRVEEAIKGAGILGVTPERITFLGFDDQKTGKTGAISRRIGALFEELSPKEIFVPSPLDVHQDHRNIAHATATALGDWKHSANCWIYEVWTPLYPNSIIDISHAVEIKRKAVQVHRSQSAVIDYQDKILGLNSFRSITQTGVKYAEAFIKCTPKEYRELTSAVVG